MAETRITNIGSDSHMGSSQLPRDSHFAYDYLFRRVPIPVTSYLAVADSSRELPAGENGAKLALDQLREYIEPAVIEADELDRSHMEPLINESFAQVNDRLFEMSREKGLPENMTVSLTIVLTSRNRAFIGHVGSTRVYLLHDRRLFDLTPTGEFTGGGPPTDSTPTLFEMPPKDGSAVVEVEEEASGEGGSLSSGPVSEKTARAEKSGHLGSSQEVRVGYNEVEIVPGDIIVLCTDGLWKSVSEEEMVEDLLSSMNVQRSSSRLAELAYNRDPSDNATMVAWQFVIPEEASTRQREVIKRARKERATDVMVVMLLVLVLACIFAVGAVLGWKVTDTIRKPEPVVVVQESEEAEPSDDETSDEEPAEEVEPESPAQTATVNSSGVRMRFEPDVKSKIVGLLREGQVVVVLGESVGADSKTWTRARGTVTSGGESVEAEGYIRNDFLDKEPQPEEPSASAPGNATSP